MYKETGALLQHNNATVLDGIRGDMSTHYRRDVPLATQGSLADTQRKIQNYRPHMNEVIQALVNRIGREVLRRNSWRNKMAVFKLGELEWGDTVEEIQVGTLTAHTYNPDRETTVEELYGTETPDVQTSFHTVNRQEYYRVTITRAMLKRAFLNDTGLTDMINELIESATTSDNRDEFLQMTEMFKLYDANGGFFRVNIPDVAISSSDEADAKAALRTIKSEVGNLEFMNPKYNAAKMDIAVDMDALVLFTTPEFKAAIDVNALAQMFNLEYGQAVERIITVPASRMPAKDVQAILTTDKFFMVMDTLFETHTVENQVKLTYNVLLHHHSIISVSRFAPAIAFTTGPGTEDTIVEEPVTGISAVTIDGDTAESIDVVRGKSYQLNAHGTTATAGVETAVRWDVEGESTFTTHITAEGVLHVSGLEEGVAGATEEDPRTIVARATTVWVDPANPRKVPFTKTLTLNVVGATLAKWPVPLP